MIEYELINPSDPYTFVAADKEVACAMIACAVPILKEMTGMIKVNE